jgi:hypothetical protein
MGRYRGALQIPGSFTPTMTALASVLGGQDGVVEAKAKRASPGAGASAGSRDHRAVAPQLGMTGVKRWRLISSGAGRTRTRARALERHPSRLQARAPDPTAGVHGRGPSREELWLTQMPKECFHCQPVRDEGDEPHPGSAQAAARGRDQRCEILDQFDGVRRSSVRPSVCGLGKR